MQSKKPQELAKPFVGMKSQRRKGVNLGENMHDVVLLDKSQIIAISGENA